METRVVTTRLPDIYIHELQSLAQEEHIERAVLIRKLLLDSLEDYMLKKAAESYQRGDIGIEEAAVRAKVSTWRMIEYLRKHNITSPPETLGELGEGIKRSEDIMKRSK